MKYASGTPMSVKYGNTTYYYAANIQGDIMAILDTAGNAVVEYTYDAWGNIHSVTGSLANTIGETNPLTYRGYVYDHEIGYYYLQSRYYDPEVGRFINGDEYAATGTGLLGSNMFAYCNNNSVNLFDKTGTLPFSVKPMQVAVNDGGYPLRDVTDEVVAALKDAVTKARAMHASGNMNAAEILVEFYKMVNHEAPWDIKRQQPWETTIRTPFPGYNREVIFCGEIMTTESLGNFTYGYLGYEYGYPLDVLYVGSYYAAGFPLFDFPELANEYNDWRYINKGYMYAKTEHLTGVIDIYD